jgi:hypothetical protein
MFEQARRPAAQVHDRWFPLQSDDPETRYRSRIAEDDTRFRIDAVPDMESAKLTPLGVNVTVADAGIRSIEWSLVAPDGRVLPDKVRTKPGDADATSRPFQLRPEQLGMTGRYTLTCTGFDSAESMYLIAHRDFRVTGADLTTLSEVGGKHGQLTFVDYRVDTATVPGSAVIRTEIDFLPNDAIQCSQVGWIQAVQALTLDGESIYRYMADPDLDARSTPLSWKIDREAGAPSPFYGTQKDPKSGALEMNPKQGHFGKTPTHDETLLHDDPVIGSAAMVKFESCAVCRSGADAGQVYGCATWGFTGDDQGGAKLHPRTFSIVPSPQFSAATAKWNTWRSTVKKKPPEEVPALRTP